MFPWFDDEFIQEELIFPEYGGVIGTVVLDCPHCHRTEEVEVDMEGVCTAHPCSHCGRTFSVAPPEG